MPPSYRATAETQRPNPAETYERVAKLAQCAESPQSVRRAMSEQGRGLEAFAAEFEAERGIRR